MILPVGCVLFSHSYNAIVAPALCNHLDGRDGMALCHYMDQYTN